MRLTKVLDPRAVLSISDQTQTLSSENFLRSQESDLNTKMEDEQQRKEQAQKLFVDILKEDNEELRNQNRDLRKLLKQKRVAWETKKKPEEEDNSDPLVTQSTMMGFLIQYGGLSRWAITDDAWHAMHPTAANQLFGFKDWADAKR
jgi:hypothetical protein